MGVMNGTGMSDAMAKHMTGLVPPSMGGHFPIITAVISCFGTFFLSNDAFYYGVLPLLAEAGYAYGFTPLTMGVAAAMGQASTSSARSSAPSGCSSSSPMKTSPISSASW